MSRRVLAVVPVLIAASPFAASAQDALQAQSATPPERIDLRVQPEDDGPKFEDCSAEQDAAEISGEIIVCRRQTGDENRLYDKEAAERRHAQRTQGQKPVEMFGIPNHGPVVARGCFIPPCPPPMAVLIDIEALPEAPPGSDADRIARGLAPLGRETPVSQLSEPQVVTKPGRQDNADALGLPPAPQGQAAGVSPSGSASPEAEPSG